MDSPERLCEQLKEAIDNRTSYYTQRLAYLENQVDYYKDELAKDKEIQRMTDKLNEAQAALNRGFPISEKEEKKVKEWYHNHIKTKHGGNYYAGAFGGGCQYIFTPTSIGVFGTFKCTKCGELFEFQEEA